MPRPPTVRRENARVRKSKQEGTDLRSANIRKRAEEKERRRIERSIERRRADALREQEEALADQQQVKQELTANSDLKERIDLLVGKHRPAYTMMSPEEKAITVELWHEGFSRRKIAEILGRELTTISRFLQRYSSTTTASRMYFQANADRLARRVVKNANVEESLEVLDRLDVLPKKDRRDGSEAPRWNIVIGGPGAVSAAPIPTQRDIEAARTAKALPALAPAPAPEPPDGH